MLVPLSRYNFNLNFVNSVCYLCLPGVKTHYHSHLSLNVVMVSCRTSSDFRTRFGVRFLVGYVGLGVLE